MSRPNLLFLFTDEQRFDTMAAYGNEQIETPNLNRLASESVVFDRAYVTQPVCTPSRSTLLTGLYPHTNGCTANNIPLRPDTPCLPEMLSDGDYAAAYHGKWHLGDEIFAQHGFQEWISIEDGYCGHYAEGRDPNACSSYHQFLSSQGFTPQNGRHFGRGEATRLPEEYGKPAFLARTASRFIRENKDRPFCLFVNFLEPHMPFFGPRDDQYNPDRVPLPPNFENVPTADQPLKARAFQQYYPQAWGVETEADWRQLIARYWGLCSLVDTHVGTILNTLEQCGLADDTIVVYTSDHGDMMGSHRLVAKCVMYEEAVRVPMLVRLPGQRQSKRVQGPTSQVDLVPTLLDLMDQPAPDHLQGQSLRTLMEADSPTADRDVFIEWNGADSGTKVVESGPSIASEEELLASVSDPVRTVLTPDGWKLNCSPLGDHELYDLNSDPHETTNLAADPDHRPQMEQLHTRIRKWQETTEDEVDCQL